MSGELLEARGLQKELLYICTIREAVMDLEFPFSAPGLMNSELYLDLRQKTL